MKQLNNYKSTTSGAMGTEVLLLVIQLLVDMEIIAPIRRKRNVIALSSGCGLCFSTCNIIL